MVMAVQTLSPCTLQLGTCCTDSQLAQSLLQSLLFIPLLRLKSGPCMNQQDLRIPEVPRGVDAHTQQCKRREFSYSLRVHWVLQANSGSEERSACQSVVAILSLSSHRQPGSQTNLVEIRLDRLLRPLPTLSRLYDSPNITDQKVCLILKIFN